MADEDRSAHLDDGRPGPAQSDSDWFFQNRSDQAASTGAHHQPGYYGPFGPPGSAEEPTMALPPARLPSGQAPPGQLPAGRLPAAGPPPPGYQPPPGALRPLVPPPPPMAPPRRSRTGLTLLLAALVATLVGALAGYGGARLAQNTAPATVPVASPSRAPANPLPEPQPTPLPAASSGTIDSVQVAAAALPSTVMIRIDSGGSEGTGSGFVLDTAGHIMTNNHVVAEAADGGRITVVFSDGARARAELVGRSPSYDLAVIKVSGSHELTPMRIGDSDQVRVGEAVLAIGSPLALASTVTQGIVSAKNRPVVVNADGGADSPTAFINGIQTDAAINPGNSGGPLVDAQARVVGVNSAILTLGQSRDTSGNIGLGFAIPVNQAMQIGSLLISDGKATYPVIGVNVGEGGEDGVRLSQVDPDGPADRAGLRVGDQITAIDGQRVLASEELVVAIRVHRPGDRVTLTYQRDGRESAVEVTLGSREG